MYQCKRINLTNDKITPHHYETLTDLFRGMNLNSARQRACYRHLPYTFIDGDHLFVVDFKLDQK